jgi:hypothetical protein
LAGQLKPFGSRFVDLEGREAAELHDLLCHCWFHAVLEGLGDGALGCGLPMGLAVLEPERLERFSRQLCEIREQNLGWDCERRRWLLGLGKVLPTPLGRCRHDLCCALKANCLELRRFELGAECGNFGRVFARLNPPFAGVVCCCHFVGLLKIRLGKSLLLA